MKDLLTHSYAVQIDGEETIDGKVGYKSNGYVYFTIPVENKKAIIMEQTILAYYLAEMGYRHTALPIQNIEGKWITEHNEKDYIIVQAKRVKNHPRKDHGLLLANFHRLLRSLVYEPQSISSYGKWKALWINKLTFFENKVIAEADKYPTPYYRLIIDVLPYIIGISENAIQYIQESERERRYGSSDQGTITFIRYGSHLFDPVIWPNDLVYDHLSRDIAEYIRGKFIDGEERSVEEVYVFLKEYESIHQLTPFSWRSLYGRLIYPIHLFDLLESGFNTTTDHHEIKLRKMLEKQARYERRVRHLFEDLKQNDKNLQIPVVQWL